MPHWIWAKQCESFSRLREKVAVKPPDEGRAAAG
jgi:hypothetical protein